MYLIPIDTALFNRYACSDVETAVTVEIVVIRQLHRLGFQFCLAKLANISIISLLNQCRNCLSNCYMVHTAAASTSTHGRILHAAAAKSCTLLLKSYLKSLKS